MDLSESYSEENNISLEIEPFINFKDDLFGEAFNNSKNIITSESKYYFNSPFELIKPIEPIELQSYSLYSRKINVTIGEKIKKHKKKDRTDNMLKKVQGHYISFIIKFVNFILDILEYEDKFYKIDYKYITNIKKDYFSFLKKSTILEILNQDVSPRILKHPKDNNKMILEKIRNKPVVNKLLSQNYIYLFKSIYYKSERNINLNNYGLDINIKLPKSIEMFNDLLAKNIKKQNPEYITKFKEYVNKEFYVLA